MKTLGFIWREILCPLVYLVALTLQGHLGHLGWVAALLGMLILHESQAIQEAIRGDD